MLYVRMITLTVLYAVLFVFSVTGLCVSDAITCSAGSDLELRKAFFPMMLATLILLAVSGFVAWLYTAITSRHSPMTKSAVHFLVVGFLVGLLPRILWTLVSGSYPEEFYPQPEYLLFGFAGMLMALVDISWLRRSGKSGPDPDSSVK